MVDLEPAKPASPDKLLLIEDDASVRRSLQLVLTGADFQVLAFSSALQALALPQGRNASHLVIDYALPGLSGIQTLEAFKASGWRGTAVLITAFHSEHVSKAAARAGFSAVIAKPFRENTLVDALRPAPIHSHA